MIKKGYKFEKIDSEERDSDIDKATYKIKTYGADLTLELLSRKIDDGEIITPEFQRRFIWPLKKASKLIESFLLGLPVPQIYLYREEDTQNLLIVDGQQRLKTINYFIKEKFKEKSSFYLRGVKPMWEGKTYSALSEADKRRFNNYILRVIIFEQTDPKDNKSVFEIFERLNTGGMTLTEQEIRNCVIRGNISKFLKKLNGYKNWRNLINKPKPDTRMKDIEMILRFFALLDNWKRYKAPMKDFITDFMRSKKNISESEQKHYEKIFYNVIDKLYEEIGIESFRLKGGINIAVFDSIVMALAVINPEKVTGIKDKIKLLKKGEAYIDSVTLATTDSERVKSRIKLVIQALSR